MTSSPLFAGFASTIQKSASSSFDSWMNGSSLPSASVTLDTRSVGKRLRGTAATPSIIDEKVVVATPLISPLP